MSRPEESLPSFNASKDNVISGTGLSGQLYEAAGDCFSPGETAPDPYRRYAITDKGDALYLYRQLERADPAQASIRSGSLGYEYEYCVDWYSARAEGTPFSPLLRAMIIKDGDTRAAFAWRLSGDETNGYNNRIVPIEGDDMIMAGAGLLKTLQSAAVTTRDNYYEVQQQRPSVMVFGREAVRTWESVQPTADRFMNFESSKRPGPDDYLRKVWRVVTTYEHNFTVHAFSMTRKLLHGQDIVNYGASLTPGDLAPNHKWLKVEGTYSYDRRNSTLAYSIDTSHGTKQQWPIYLNPDTRWEVYEAIDRHIYPENLALAREFRFR